MVREIWHISGSFVIVGFGAWVIYHVVRGTEGARRFALSGAAALVAVFIVVMVVTLL